MVPRPSVALSWSTVFQARSRRSRSSSPHRAGCRTASGKSSAIITPHLLYRKLSRHSRSPRRTANATTSPVSLVVAAKRAEAPFEYNGSLLKVLVCEDEEIVASDLVAAHLLCSSRRIACEGFAHLRPERDRSPEAPGDGDSFRVGSISSKGRQEIPRSS